MFVFLLQAPERQSLAPKVWGSHGLAKAARGEAPSWLIPATFYVRDAPALAYLSLGVRSTSDGEPFVLALAHGDLVSEEPLSARPFPLGFTFRAPFVASFHRCRAGGI